MRRQGAGERHVIPSLVDTASSSERLSNLTVTDDRAKPVSSYLARARTCAIAAAAAKATRDARESVPTSMLPSKT